MISSSRWAIPESWAWPMVCEIASITGGGTPPSKDPENFSKSSGIPWLTPADLTGYASPYISRGKRNLTKQGYKASSAKTLPPKSVLFTSRAPIGYCAIALSEIATNQGFKSLTLYDEISPEYTRHYLKWSKAYLEGRASGTTFLELSGKKFSAVPFPLPPLAEQKRIVAKLESLSAKSARARDDLTKIDTLVTRYKQAVLQKAFSGELTKEWRNQKGYQSNAEMLAIEKIPLDWQIERLGDVAEIQSGVALGKKRKAGVELFDIPYLRVANVQRGWLNLDKIKQTAVTSTEAKKLYLQRGDILMNEGGDRDKLGRGWVWEGQIDHCIHQNHVFRVRLKNTAFPPRFLSYFANEFGQRHFFDKGKQTTNLASISKSKLSAMNIPIPSADEASAIVLRIEELFEKITRLALEAKQALKLLGRLDEAILAKAFKGELVPQDPEDEPANVLLDRIRAEREAAAKPNKARKARKARKQTKAKRS